MSALCAIATLALSSPSRADTNPENQRTVEGVRAVEAHWGRAFVSGDEAYLDQLLDPGYVSVNQKGKARPRSEILALSKKIAAMPPKPSDPTPSSNIVVRGDAAVVTSSSGGDTSVDVFYYQDGHWKAWYSQHTPVAPPAG